MVVLLAARSPARCSGSSPLLPHTMMSSSLLPHTTMSSSLLPHTTMSPSLLPHTTMSSSLVAHRVSSQSSPSQVSPQTTFTDCSEPQTLVSQLLHPLPPTPHSVPEHTTPHVTSSSPASVAAPHATLVAHALAVAIRSPPCTWWLPQMICRLHSGGDGARAAGTVLKARARSTAPRALRKPAPCAR